MRKSKTGFWGASYQKEKRTYKELPEVLVEKGLPFEHVVNAFYFTRLRLFGKMRYVGKRGTAKAAARLYDSALFHLWGFCERPAVSKFNFFKPGEIPPEEFPEVKHLRRNLRQWMPADLFDASNFSFPDRAHNL